MTSKKELSEKIELLKKTVFEMYPNATTELEHENDFQLLIAIAMSAQATDIQVNKVNKILFSIIKTPEDILDMWVDTLKSYIKSLSFFNNKAENIYKTSQLLVEKYNSQPPKTLDELVTLPWVWIKTAKVFLSVTQKAPYLWVDTHVHRVLNRIGIVTTKTPEQTDKKAETIFSPDDLAPLHNTLVLFGRYHCIARKPKCEGCSIAPVCRYHKQSNTS